MPRCILSQIEADEGHAEGGQPALQIEQPAARQQAVSGLLERSPAERERLGQVRGADEGERIEHVVAVEPIFDRTQGRRQTFAWCAEQRSIRFRGAVGPLHQLRAAVAHRELEPQGIHLAQVEARGLPARQEHDGAGHLRGHRRVAVAVAANPRPEAERRSIRREPAAGVFDERRVQGAEELRQRVPQRLLEHGQSRPGFVHRRGTARTHLARFPRRGNLDAERLDELFVFGRREIHPIARGEQIGDAAELLHQRAACDLGGMRGEHQLDPQPRDRLVEAIGRDAGSDQAAERLVARSDLRRRRGIALIRPPAPDAMVLLGDVRQVEKV